MSLDKKFEDLFLNVSIKAALSSYHFVGKKDKIAADKSAVDAMRNKLNEIEMRGKVVIGEGELDEAACREALKQLMECCTVSTADRVVRI